jgi:hypothetical protein
MEMENVEARGAETGEERSSSTEVQVTLLFLGSGLLAYVIIPGLLVIWDRVLDYMAGY